MLIDTERGLYPAMVEELARFTYKPGTTMKLFTKVETVGTGTNSTPTSHSLWLEASIEVTSDVVGDGGFTVNRWYPMCHDPEVNTVTQTRLMQHEYVDYVQLHEWWNMGQWHLVAAYLAIVVQRVWQDIELHELKEWLLRDGEFVSNPHPEVDGYHTHKGLANNGGLACDIGGVCSLYPVYAQEGSEQRGGLSNAHSGGNAPGGGGVYDQDQENEIEDDWYLDRTEDVLMWDDMGTYYQAEDHSKSESHIIKGEQ